MESGRQNYPDAFADVPAEAEEGLQDTEMLGPFGMRARLVHLTRAAYATKAHINLNLFPAASLARTHSSGDPNLPLELTAIVERAEEQGGVLVRTGTLEDDPDSTLTIATYEDVASLTLSSARHGVFEATVFSEHSQVYVLRQLDEKKLPDCGVGQRDRAGHSNREAEDSFEDSESESEDRESEREFEARETVIDLLVVYTTRTKNALGGAAATRARAAEAVMRGNQTLGNSNLSNVRVNLVHTEELPGYSETSGLDGFYTMLDQLVAGTASGLTGLHALRDRVRADMVSLFVANPSLGGLANIMHGVSSGFARLAYSVVNYGLAASTWTLIHELGHNFGCCHETACNRVRTYARGHSFSARGATFKTVMVRKSQPGTRIPFFSNPNVTYKGVATGIANSRDNARAIRTAAVTVSAFR